MNDFCEIVHVFVRELRQIDLAVAFLLGCAMKLGEKRTTTSNTHHKCTYIYYIIFCELWWIVQLPQ